MAMKRRSSIQDVAYGLKVPVGTAQPMELTEEEAAEVEAIISKGLMVGCRPATLGHITIPTNYSNGE